VHSALVKQKGRAKTAPVPASADPGVGHFCEEGLARRKISSEPAASLDKVAPSRPCARRTVAEDMAAALRRRRGTW